MPHRRIVLVASLLASAVMLPAQDAQKKGESRRGAVSRELELALMKLERAKTDVDDQLADNAAALEKAENGISFARERLKSFVEGEAPLRTAKAELLVKEAADAVEDEKSELDRVRALYEKADIGDKSKAAVLARAERSRRRAEERLNLARQEKTSLTERTLPAERARLELDLKEREGDAAHARRVGEKARFDKELALKAAELDVRKLKEDAGAGGGAK